METKRDWQLRSVQVIVHLAIIAQEAPFNQLNVRKELTLVELRGLVLVVQELVALP